MYTYVPFVKSFTILSKRLELYKDKIENSATRIEIKTIWNLVR
jgi:hypothetical protein